MENKDIVCPECGATISKWADVCIECGYPNNEYEERLSEDNVRAQAKERYVEGEGANSYEVINVDYELNDTTLEITAFIQKTEESDDCNGEGDHFWLTMFDPNGDDISSVHKGLKFAGSGTRIICATKIRNNFIPLQRFNIV